MTQFVPNATLLNEYKEHASWKSSKGSHLLWQRKYTSEQREETLSREERAAISDGSVRFGSRSGLFSPNAEPEPNVRFKKKLNAELERVFTFSSAFERKITQGSRMQHLRLPVCAKSNIKDDTALEAGFGRLMPHQQRSNSRELQCLGRGTPVQRIGERERRTRVRFSSVQVRTDSANRTHPTLAAIDKASVKRDYKELQSASEQRGQISQSIKVCCLEGQRKWISSGRGQGVVV
ncbi:hypothetical protein FB45DRAFT_868106 [Roridomyces roridus]|uniref:Uncharacterized protein n=1 Tax=Roridomyces roridus TaxID=1738132 RepID=A0AAD7BP51_9AGAR|nr:hypothetical protein FB45DRAFT_868106 [Roridomyces roridus]